MSVTASERIARKFCKRDCALLHEAGRRHDDEASLVAGQPMRRVRLLSQECSILNSWTRCCSARSCGTGQRQRDTRRGGTLMDTHPGDRSPQRRDNHNVVVVLSEQGSASSEEVALDLRGLQRKTSSASRPARGAQRGEESCGQVRTS